LREYAKKLAMKPAETSVAVQGLGNVGYWFAKSAYDLGFKVIGLSDSRGAVWSEGGFDPEEVLFHKKQTGSVADFPGRETLSEAQFFARKVDVLVPAALENAITEENAGRVRAKVIIEMANGPLTANASRFLIEKGIRVVPDILANAGGVAASYLEWRQNLDKQSWAEKQVLDRLEEIMTRAFDAVWELSQKEKIDMKLAAYMIAVDRIVRAMKQKES